MGTVIFLCPFFCGAACSPLSYSILPKCEAIHCGEVGEFIGASRNGRLSLSREKKQEGFEMGATMLEEMVTWVRLADFRREAEQIARQRRALGAARCEQLARARRTG